MSQWIEGIHYYLNEEGLMVLTKKFHQERGYCCGNGCKHCPYEYENVPDPKTPKPPKGGLEDPTK